MRAIYERFKEENKLYSYKSSDRLFLTTKAEKGHRRKEVLI